MIVAPSGAGKSSLVNALLQEEVGLKLSLSTTTRAPRPGEVAAGVTDRDMLTKVPL